LRSGRRRPTRPGPDITGGHTRSGASIARARLSIVTLALLGLVAAAPSGPSAQTFPGPPSVEQLARRADVVVLGEVRIAAGEWDPIRSNVSTRVELARTELLKGTARSPVSFQQLGGRAGGTTSAVGGAAEFRRGERVLVFLARRPGGPLALVDLLHGKFSIERDAATGRDYAVRAVGARSADRIELEDVRALVRRALGGRRQ
jgi:hypothetical protein